MKIYGLCVSILCFVSYVIYVIWFNITANSMSYVDSNSWAINQNPVLPVFVLLFGMISFANWIFQDDVKEMDKEK